MKEKIFLTSAIAMGFVAPAMADPERLSTFPNASNNEFMQENKIYTDAATSTNMAGVYEGEVDAVAQYTDNLYQLVAGQYLPANSETPITCDQNGYFCPGDSNGVYYQNYSQGLTQCPTGYGNTANGASANTDCYRTCTNADVAHSSGTVNGGYYYGDNNQCSPTACVNGYHVKAGTPDLMTVIGTTEAGSGVGYKSISGTGINSNESTYGITNNGEFVVDYGNKGKIRGYSRCSTRSATKAWVNGAGPDGYDMYVLQSDSTSLSLSDDNTGQYCYCHLDSYTSYGSNTYIALSGPWVIERMIGSNSACMEVCAKYCGEKLQEYNPAAISFRAAVFGAYPVGLAMCEANTITINWGDTDLADVTANEAGTATYGSDIRTPVKAQTKPGKTFTGWRFVAPEQASVGEQ